MQETDTDRAYRMFCEVMQSVTDQGENADRQPALETINAILLAQFSESETRALIGAVTRSVIDGELDHDAMKEWGATVRYQGQATANLNDLELVAIQYFDEGKPSALPNGNPYKGYVENHRWGYHGANNNLNCPVCVRNRKG